MGGGGVWCVEGVGEAGGGGGIVGGRGPFVQYAFFTIKMHVYLIITFALYVMTLVRPLKKMKFFILEWCNETESLFSDETVENFGWLPLVRSWHLVYDWQ